jgi:Ca2+-binding EF-hand superfamily protein
LIVDDVAVPGESIMTYLRLPTLLLLLIAVASIHADDKQEKTPPGNAILKMTPEQLLKLWDKNKNGFVEKDEAPPRIQAVFDQFDRNGDGKLDQSELTALLDTLKKRMAAQDTEKANANGKKKSASADLDRQIDALLRRLDANGDGKISRKEAEGRPLAKAFDVLDRNKDGYLDRKELMGWVQRMGKAGGNDGEKGRPGAALVTGNNAADFDSLDKDADGRLTREELQGTKWAELFDKIDANKDGRIDRKEFENYLRQTTEPATPESAKTGNTKKN